MLLLSKYTITEIDPSAVDVKRYNKKIMSFVAAITFAFHALLLTLPFVFTWSNSELFEFNKMLAVYGFTVVIGSLWLARMIREKRFIWRQDPIALLVLIFLTGQAVATLFSIHFRTSIFGFYSRLNGGFLSSLSYTILVLALINNVSKKQTLPLLLTTLVGAFLAALYALPEHFGVSPSCYLIQKKWDVACWKQDVQARVFGTFGQPNWLAMYLIGSIPIAWVFLQKQGKAKNFWLGTLAVFLLVLWFTQSRSGFVALAAGVATLALFHWQAVWLKKMKALLRPRWLRATGVVGIIGVLLAGGVLLGKVIPSSEGGESFDLSQGTGSGSIRLIVWRGALKVWQRAPWFGSGPGTFAYSYYQDRPVEHNLVSEWNFLYNKAHNEFLNYLAETGLVGLTTYLTFLIGLFWLLQVKQTRKSPVVTVHQAVFASLVGLSVTHFFGFSTVTSNLLLFLLPAIALLQPKTDTANFPKRLKPWQKLSFGGLALVVIALFWQLLAIWEADWWYTNGKKLQTELEYAEAVTALQTATKIKPTEALYYDELANLYSKLALEYSLVGETTASAHLTEAALQNTDFTLLLNPHHLNFYKTRVRVLFMLAQIDQQYLAQAEKTLKAALELAPTDAQLWYNLGIVQQELSKYDEAVQTLQYTVNLKPNYVRARSQLGDLLIQLGRIEEGKAQYQFILEKLSSTDEEVRTKLNALETPTTE